MRPVMHTGQKVLLPMAAKHLRYCTRNAAYSDAIVQGMIQRVSKETFIGLHLLCSSNSQLSNSFELIPR
jgi:hypothetical protein